MSYRTSLKGQWTFIYTVPTSVSWDMWTWSYQRWVENAFNHCSPTESKHEGRIAQRFEPHIPYRTNVFTTIEWKSCKRNHTRYSVAFAGRFQAMSFMACHEGLDVMSFHHLQWTRQKSRISKFEHIPRLWTFGRLSTLPNSSFSNTTLPRGKWNKSARVISCSSKSLDQQR